jgi:hypothetical protein
MSISTLDFDRLKAFYQQMSRNVAGALDASPAARSYSSRLQTLSEDRPVRPEESEEAHVGVMLQETAARKSLRDSLLSSRLHEALASNVEQQSILSSLQNNLSLQRSQRIASGSGSIRYVVNDDQRNSKGLSLGNQFEKLKGRGPPSSLIGVLDSPTPLDRKACWDDPVYFSNSVIPVRIQGHLMELKQIDTVQQEFHAHMWIQMLWRPLSYSSDPQEG